MTIHYQIATNLMLLLKEIMQMFHSKTTDQFSHLILTAEILRLLVKVGCILK
jgi:hypothetical protein